VSVSEPLVQAGLLGEAIDQGPVLVFVADDELRYVAVNEFAARTLGYTRPELLGLRVTDVTRYEDAGQDFTELLRGKRMTSGTARLACKDGRELRMEYRAAETRVASMAFYVSVGWLV
jgi:PAS domain S-box-containing protein